MNGAAPPTDRLAWTVHPLRRSWKAAIFTSLIVAAVPVLIHLVYGDPWLSLLALLVLVFSLRTFYLPTSYTLDKDGVTCACFPLRVRRSWDAFKSCQPGPGMIRLSTFSSPHRLDPYRGLLLRFDGDGSQIRAFLERRIRPD